MQILTREGRLVLAGKHRKALRRYQYEIEQRRPLIAPGHFDYLGVRPLGRFQWMPGMQMMGVLITRSSGGGGGGGGDFDGHVPSVTVDTAAEFLTELGSGVLLAGTILGVEPGAYVGTPAGDVDNTPIFNVGTTGTLGSPIVVVARHMAAYNAGSPSLLTELRSSNPFTGSADPLDPLWTSNNPVIGVVSRNYVNFKGLYFNMALSPPRPSNGSILLQSSDNCRIEKCHFDQIETSDGDNFSAVFIRDCDNAYVGNCKAVGGSSPVNQFNHNCAFLITYGSLGTLLEHLEGVNCNQFVFIKGTVGAGVRNSGTLRLSKLTDATQAFADFTSIDATAGFDVIQCLGIRCTRGIVMDNSAASESGYVRANDSTFVDLSGSGSPDSLTAGGLDFESGTVTTGTEFKRNIVAWTSSRTNQYAVKYSDTLTPANTDLNDNLYWESGGACQWRQNGTNYSTLGDWQTATSKEGSSQEGTPNFINAAADNYRRSSYADSRGCYKTGFEQIGLEAA